MKFIFGSAFGILRFLVPVPQGDSFTTLLDYIKTFLKNLFGASNAAAILTREQYMKGFYTKREAGYIMTNFSLVSIPFCLLVATTVNISGLFPAFYGSICLTGIVLAVVIARIPPIRTLPDTYQEQVGQQLYEDVPPEKGRLKYAVELGCKRAETFHAKNVLESGLEVVMGMLFDLIPIVIA